MELYVRQLRLGPADNFVYLLGAAGAREVAVVDPAWDVGAILAAAEEDGKEIAGAFLTHSHADHMNGVGPLLAFVPGIPVYVQRAEVEFSQQLRWLGEAIVPTEPDQRVAVGPLEVRCIRTPGHTPGSQCLYCGGTLLTGDTLFIDGCGRCDLPGGDPAAMFDSLHRTIGALPDETLVYPGHDYADRSVSTLADEKRQNPYFLRRDLDSFVALRMRPRT